LCRRHHRAVHEGGFTIVQRDEGSPVFYRPDGTCVEIAPALHRGEWVAAAPGPATARRIAPCAAFGPYTAMARVDHGRFDVAWAIDILRDECSRDFVHRSPTAIDSSSAGP
jgi:hypothetical protein